MAVRRGVINVICQGLDYHTIWVWSVLNKSMKLMTVFQRFCKYLKWKCHRFENARRHVTDMQPVLLEEQEKPDKSCNIIQDFHRWQGMAVQHKTLFSFLIVLHYTNRTSHSLIARPAVVSPPYIFILLLIYPFTGHSMASWSSTFLFRYEFKQAGHLGYSA